MYEPLIFIHSWTRWLVLSGILYFLTKSVYSIWRARPWRPADNHFIWAFSQVFGYQVLFGLFLWIGASPFLKIVIRNPEIISSDGTVSFWAIRHPLTMLLAIAIFQIGSARARKSSLENKFKVFAITFTIVLILICTAIPWAWLSYGRPWLRSF